MSKLDRWLPNKFRRTKAEEKKTGRGEHALAATGSSGAGPSSGQMGLSPAAMLMPMNQLFQNMLGSSLLGDTLLRDPLARFGELDRWFGDFSPGRFLPTVDVVDEESALRVSSELPGMSKDDIQVTVDHDLLTIRGEKRNTEESRENGVFRSERYYGQFQRSVPLPGDLDSDNVAAHFDKGILTVRIPKRSDVRSTAKSIPVKDAGSA